MVFIPAVGPTAVTSISNMKKNDAMATKPTIIEQIVGSIPQLLNAGFTIAQANSIIKINRDRLARGLPPLSAAEMQSLQTGARVDVGVSPDLKKSLMIGGIALIGILLLLALKK